MKQKIPSHFFREIRFLYDRRRVNGISCLRYVYVDISFSPHGKMAKVLDCCLEVSELELQSSYYVHFQANTLEKGLNPLILTDQWIR